MIFIKDKHQFEVNLLKITFIFDKRWYEKYDIFKLGNVEYICVSRPKKNEDNTWTIEAIPLEILRKDDGGYDTEFIKNNLSYL